MAGLPFHAADNYVGKLLAAGKKIAICDQAEPAKAGKLVKRQLTRILQGYPMRQVAEPLIVRGEPQPADLASAAELGQALAAGLELGIF